MHPLYKGWITKQYVCSYFPIRYWRLFRLRVSNAIESVILHNGSWQLASLTNTSRKWWRHSLWHCCLYIRENHIYGVVLIFIKSLCFYIILQYTVTTVSQKEAAPLAFVSNISIGNLIHACVVVWMSSV